MTRENHFLSFRPKSLKVVTESFFWRKNAGMSFFFFRYYFVFLNPMTAKAEARESASIPVGAMTVT